MATNELKEAVIFRQYYAKLCHTLTDIQYLLPEFVTENIIKQSDIEEIDALSTSLQKRQKLLLHISDPLQAGHLHGFYTMLRIMEVHGTYATQELAKEIKNSLFPGMYIKQLPSYEK